MNMCNFHTTAVSWTGTEYKKAGVCRTLFCSFCIGHKQISKFVGICHRWRGKGVAWLPWQGAESSVMSKRRCFQGGAAHFEISTDRVLTISILK
jgi:hypothetical protein